MLKDNYSSVKSQFNYFVCKHYLGDQNTTNLISSPSSNLSDKSRVKQSVGINWGNMLKAVPTVIGHVVSIGTQIATVLAIKDKQDVVATKTMSTNSVDFAPAAYTLVTSDVG